MLQLEMVDVQTRLLAKPDEPRRADAQQEPQHEAADLQIASRRRIRFKPCSESCLGPGKLSHNRAVSAALQFGAADIGATSFHRRVRTRLYRLIRSLESHAQYRDRRVFLRLSLACCRFLCRLLEKEQTYKRGCRPVARHSSSR